MPLKDLTQYTDEEISGLSDAEITELLPSIGDEPARDALVKVLWARAARQAQAGHVIPETQD